MQDTSKHTELFRKVQGEIKAQHEKLGSWAKVGRHYGVHRAIVWRIVKDDYEPKDREIRMKLGLTEFIVAEQERDAKGRFRKRK